MPRDAAGQAEQCAWLFDRGGWLSPRRPPFFHRAQIAPDGRVVFTESSSPAARVLAIGAMAAVSIGPLLFMMSWTHDLRDAVANTVIFLLIGAGMAYVAIRLGRQQRTLSFDTGGGVFTLTCRGLRRPPKTYASGQAALYTQEIQLYSSRLPFYAAVVHLGSGFRAARFVLACCHAEGPIDAYIRSLPPALAALHGGRAQSVLLHGFGAVRFAAAARVSRGECIHCGYPRRDLESEKCPECGADWLAE